MQPNESILINVNIDNRAMRLRVAVKDEEDVRLSAQVLNQRINAFKSFFCTFKNFEFISLNINIDKIIKKIDNEYLNLLIDARKFIALSLLIAAILSVLLIYNERYSSTIEINIIDRNLLHEYIPNMQKVYQSIIDNNIEELNKINFSKKDYYLGLRPEHLSVSENNEYKFNPKVDLIENLGNEKIAYIKMDQYEISAKIPSHHNIENTMGFNSKDIFVFDENGKRVKS